MIYKSRGAFLHVKVVLPDVKNLVPGGRGTTEKSRWRKIGHRTKKIFFKGTREHRPRQRRENGGSHVFSLGVQEEEEDARSPGYALLPPGTDTACRDP